TLEPVKENLRGWHAVTFLGYDDAKKAFRMVNSWGADWGDRGFVWIAEDFIRRWPHEGWGMWVAGGPISRDPRSGLEQVGPHVRLEPPASGSSAAPALPQLLAREGARR